MDQAVDVVVIGGGVIGVSVARELRRAGVEQVTVLEQRPAVGQGSSSRANGGVRAQFTTKANIQFSAFSIDELEDLDRRTGLLGFKQTGYLLLTGTQAGERSLHAAFELQRSLGVDVRWLTPPQALHHAPFIRPDGLRAATFHHRDGFLDPHGLVTALRQDAARLDARIVTSAQVVAIHHTPGATLRVTTRDQSLRARWVVNAAGPAAGQVAALLGVELAVAPVRRNLAHLTDPAGPGPPIPMCVDLDTGVLVRREPGGGYVLAWSDPNDPPGWDTSVDPRFLPALAQRVGHRFPFLHDLPIDPRHCWAGLYPETPDHHAIIGPAPQAPSLIHCAGFGGHGVMHAPAAGRATAELITLGHSHTFDLHPLRPSRFAEGDLTAETAVL